MAINKNIIKLFILYSILSIIILVKAQETEENEVFEDGILQYLPEGVLRKDDQCNIIYTNFGMKEHIEGLEYEITNNSDGTFNIKIKNLVNGNMGPNQQSYFDPNVLKDLIKVEQNGNEISDKSITDVNQKTGLMSLQINNLTDCNDLKIKQTFKEKEVVVANRLYYENVIPDKINQPFDASKFGPSYSYPFKRLHWEINEGLDDLRETCGIYIYFSTVHESNIRHWQYYLSTENVNTKGCTNEEYFEVIKRNFRDGDYQYTIDLLGENYQGYVLKREGHPEEHMDGVLIDNKFLIEVYQKNCNEDNQQITVCTMDSQKKLSFTEFSQQLVKCLKLEDDQESDWEINNKIASAKFNGQIITVSNSDADSRGSLPDTVNGDINYKKINGENATPIARFMITYTCENGYYINDSCTACEGNSIIILFF